MTAYKCASKLARLRPAGSHDHGLGAHLETRSIIASKSISKLPQLQPPSSHDHGLQVHLQTRLITASKCISKLTRSGTPSVSPNPHDYGFQVRTITTSKLAQSRPRTVSSILHNYGVAQRWSYKARQPISNTPPHATWHPNGILVTEWFWLEECKQSVGGCEGIPGQVEPHKLRGFMNAWHECMRNHRKCMDL